MSDSYPVKRFTPDGLKAFAEATDRYLSDPSGPDPSFLAHQDGLTESSGAGSVQVRSFTDRFEFAKYLFDNVGPADGSTFRPDPGAMDWLAAFYFRVLTSADTTLKLGHISRYVLSSDFRKSYRHLVAGPLETYAAGGDSSRLILCDSTLDTPGDAYEQLASRREIRTNPGVMDAAHHLYFEESKEARKRGATSDTRRGSLRRFIEVIQQLDLTYDIYGIDRDTIVDLLPDEFNEWRV